MEINSVDCPKCGGNIPEHISKGKLFKCNNCGSTLVWPDNQSKFFLSFGIRICPNCGVDNEHDRNFCKSCGTKLTKSCPLCEVIFYVGDKFCPNGHDYEYEHQKLEEKKQIHTFSLSYMLGKNIRQEEIQTWMSKVGVLPQIEENIRKKEGQEQATRFYNYPSKGISLWFEELDPILYAIILYSEGETGPFGAWYQQYQGDLPYGLSFLTSRRAIESILGPSERLAQNYYDTGYWVYYPSKGIRHIAYKSEQLNASIKSIAFIQSSAK